jgi:hypothetical protein
MSRYLLAVAVAALTSFGASPPKPAPQPSAADAVIESTIRTKLARSKIGANNFKFRVQNGVVYWDGTTDVAQHKGAATRMANSAGAKRVVNNIRVSDAGRAKARAHLTKGRRIVHTDASPERSEPRTAPRAAVIRR